MVKKYSQFADGEADVSSNSIVPFERDNGETAKSRISVLVDGLTVKYIHKITDFQSVVNNVIKLEQDTVYVICAEILMFNKFLIPAGWNGTIYSTHVPKNSLINLTGGTLFNTLNIDGVIDSIADSIANPSTHSTITTSAPHGLSDGDTVNIRDTEVETSYSNPRLVISNVTASTFDVEIPFTATDTGTFDTGYLGIQFPRLAVFDDGNGKLFDISATPDPTSIFAWNDVALFNFDSLGIIRKAPNLNLLSGLMTFINEGLTLEDCDTAGMHHSSISCINPLNTTAKCLTLTGDKTRDVIIDSTKLNVINPLQHPIRVDGTITNADDIVIQNSPDNNVATNYFDESSGGLNQKNKQVRTFNNGKRADSNEKCESRSDVLLVVPTTVQGTAQPIQNVSPPPGNYILDSTVEGFTMDDSTGEVTYNGRAPKTVRIEHRIEALHPTGASQALIIALHINDLEQVKTVRSIATTSSFVKYSYDGGFFDINPGDRFKSFKTNNTNTVDTHFQNEVVLIR